MTISAQRVRQLLSDGIDAQVYPGAVWAFGDAAGTAASGTVGLLDPTRVAEPMQADTPFDVASLTKILAVWAAIGTLWENGRLPLDEPLGGLWSEVAGRPLGQVTARQLLTHTAGVPLRAQLKNLYGTDPAAIRAGVLHEALHRPPGQAVEYTDRAALILGYLVEYLSGRRLDAFAGERVWGPLGMRATRFGPLPQALAQRAAPTELDQDTGVPLQGVAHDFSARLLGGVCGIAGVFSDLDDLGTFLRHLLDPATVAGVGFGAGWTEESLAVHTGSLQPARGLFWYPAPGTEPAEQIWVHYGFTGTGMWLSPKLGTWAVLLTNKVYFTRDREPLTGIRNRFRELVFS